MKRVWEMPHVNTFDGVAIQGFVRRYLRKSKVSVDPFSRNSRWCTYTNDINPKTQAEFHKDARVFLDELSQSSVQADCIILDPPYSPRQISECYKELGLQCTQQDTQNSRFYKEIKDAAHKILSPGGVVLSFGWNSAGMGDGRGYEILEILLVCHGAAHNDTICVAEMLPMFAKQRELIAESTL